MWVGKQGLLRYTFPSVSRGLGCSEVNLQDINVLSHFIREARGAPIGLNERSISPCPGFLYWFALVTSEPFLTVETLE